MRRLAVPVVAALAFAGCGGDGGDKADGARAERTFDAAIREARAVTPADLPAPRGRTLQQLADRLPAVQLGLATSVFTPGRNRLAFGIIDQDKSFVYGKTGVYLARSPGAKALGPFPAPADPLEARPAFRSSGAASEDPGHVAAIYETSIDVPKPGRWYVLAATRSQGQLFGAATQIDVRSADPTPAVGGPAPPAETDTVASAGGNLEAIETRVPPDDMHDTGLREVLGKRPVALLFATPALCRSRVCGPVTDIAAQMQSEYGDRMTFIHQEVYVDNDLKKGYRPPLKAYRLDTEPWLFTIDRDGRVAARLQGSFGTDAFRKAVEAAL